MSFRDQDRGAESGKNPVREAIEAAALGIQGESQITPSMCEILAFDQAEAKWLGALAALRSLVSDPSADDRTVEAAHSKAEREASAAFALTPVPSLRALPRKLWLIEQEAFDVADNGVCGKDLAIWLTALRLDLLRLLIRPTA